MELTPEAARGRRFTASRRGVDEAEVTAFQGEVAQALHAQLAERTRLEEQLRIAIARAAELEGAAEAVSRTFAIATRTKNEMIAEATAESERLRTEADQYAQTTRADAAADAAEMREAAGAEVADLRARVTAEAEELTTTAVAEAQAKRRSAEEDAAAARSAATGEAAAILAGATDRVSAADEHVTEEKARLNHDLALLRTRIREISAGLERLSQTTELDLDAVTEIIDNQLGVVEGLERLQMPEGLPEPAAADATGTALAEEDVVEFDGEPVAIHEETAAAELADTIIGDGLDEVAAEPADEAAPADTELPSGESAETVEAALAEAAFSAGEEPVVAEGTAEVAEAEVAEVEVAEAEVAEVEVAEAEVAEVEVAEVEVAEVEVAEVEVAEVEVAEVEVAEVEVAEVEAEAAAPVGEPEPSDPGDLVAADPWASSTTEIPAVADEDPVPAADDSGAAETDDAWAVPDAAAASLTSMAEAEPEVGGGIEPLRIDETVAAYEAGADIPIDDPVEASAALIEVTEEPVAGVSVDDAEMVVGSVEPTMASGAPISSPAMIPIDETDEVVAEEADEAVPAAEESDGPAAASTESEPSRVPPEEGGFYERRLSGLRRRIEAAEAEDAAAAGGDAPEDPQNG